MFNYTSRANLVNRLFLFCLGLTHKQVAGITFTAILACIDSTLTS